MTFLDISNGRDLAQIDLGETGVDIWQALEDSHPDMWDLLLERHVIECTECYRGSASEITTGEELKTFLEAAE